MRSARQLDAYRQALGPVEPLGSLGTSGSSGRSARQPFDDRGVAVAVRLQRLAELRTAEGYLAEVVSDDDGHVLVEHHCPVRDAAGACEGLCGAELELFRNVLGPGVSVERAQHLLSGDGRCAYRISEVSAGVR